MTNGIGLLYVRRTLILLFLLGFCMGSYAATSGSITVPGTEQQLSNGVWDNGTIVVSIAFTLNGNSSTYQNKASYGQFSTPDSVASALAAAIASDCNSPFNAKSSPGGLIYFQAKGSQNIGQIAITSSSTSGNNVSFNSGSGSPDLSILPTVTIATIGQTYLISGQPTTISVQVSCNTNCGSVNYFIDGAPWQTVTLSSTGQASLTTNTAWSPGLHNVVAQYQGNTSFMSSSSDPVSFTISTSSTQTSTSLYNYSLSYDGTGNVLSYSDTVNGNWSNISYDNVNRLTAATTSMSGTPQSMCWSYDFFGNRTAQATSTSPCNSPSPTISYNTNNQNTVLQYDSGGNVTGGDGNQYLYDAEGHICAVQYPLTAGIYGMIGYLYDAEGRRVAKGTIATWSCDPATNGFAETNGYQIGPNGEQIAEVDGGGNWIHTNVFANGELIATYDPDGLYFHLGDWLDTRRLDTDYGGNVQETFQNLPFGEMVPQNQSLGVTEQQYTGKERDSESANDYFGARYYGSSMGRFMSPDLLGAKVADSTNPQSWDFYSYGLNNPFRFMDPTGYYSCDPDTGTTDSNFSVSVTSGKCHFDPSDFLQTSLQTTIPRQQFLLQPPVFYRAPNNGNQNTRGHCLGQALKSDGNGASVALDLLGVGAGFLPGGGLVTGSANAATVAFGAQVGLTAASVGVSVGYRSGPGIVAGILGGQVALTSKAAEGLAVDVGKSIPVVGVAVSFGALLYDGYQTYSAYSGCLTGVHE